MYRLATRAHSLVGALSTRAIPLSSSIRAFSSAATPSDASAASQTNDKPANGEDDQNSVDPDKLEAYLRSKAAYQAQQEEKLKSVFSKLRSTAGTMAGASQIDPLSIPGRRPGQSLDVTDRVRQAMEYKRRREKEAEKMAQLESQLDELKELEEKTSSTKKWFSKWF